MSDDAPDPVPRARPPREDYPAPSREDLADAIAAAAADDDWSHHVRGRYTAHRTHTEHDPDGRPGAKHVTIRVEECERDIIANIPEAHAESVLSVLRGTDDD